MPPWLPVSVLCLRSHLAALESHSIRTDSSGVENGMYACCPRLASLLPPSRHLQPPACSNPLAVVQNLVGSPSPPACVIGLSLVPCTCPAPLMSPVESVEGARAESFIGNRKASALRKRYAECHLMFVWYFRSAPLTCSRSCSASLHSQGLPRSISVAFFASSFVVTMPGPSS